MAMRLSFLSASLAVIVVLGCSIATRDHLTHFFFEVPAKPAPPTDDEHPRDNAVVPVEDQPTLSLPPARFVSVHEPFRARDCQACHNPDQRMTVDDDLEASCGECHERFFSEEVGHSPVADGECLVCHNPHHSAFRALLLMSAGDTCTQCHDDPEDLSQPSHAGADAENCIKCHDPHFGEPPLLKEGVSRPAKPDG